MHDFIPLVFLLLLFIIFILYVCMYAGHFVAVVIIFMISFGYLNAFVCILAGL